MIRDRIMTCYVCGKEATRRCPRCAKPYCDEHGDELCAACQDPASAIPSGTVFRGSLLALLVASVLALWLLIQPPGLPGGEAGEEAVAVLVQLGERRPDAVALVQRVLAVAPELDAAEAIIQQVYKLKASGV